MEVSTLKKDTVERLRKVKKEQEFTISHILELLEAKGYYLKPLLNVSFLKTLMLTASNIVIP